MEECIDFLEDTKIFSALDAFWSYWQMAVAKEDEDKISFTSHVETYRSSRMLFELMSAPATLQRLLNIILNNYTWMSCME